MKKGVLLLVLFLFSFSYVLGADDCTINTVCPISKSEVPGISFYSDSNTHVNLNDLGSYKLCCDYSYLDVSEIIVGSPDFLMYNTLNSHIALDLLNWAVPFGGSYGVSVEVEGASCNGISSGSCPIGVDDFCLFSSSAGGNAHISDCSDPNYSWKLCCEFTGSGVGVCGDNIAQMPNGVGDNELCDGSDLRGFDCTSPAFGFGGGILGCNLDCTYNTSLCTGSLTICGDNNIDTPNSNGVNELCDGSDLDGKSCTDFGYSSGSLDCNIDCLDFDKSSCGSFSNPPVGPNEYLVYDPCIDDGSGDQYGTTNWILYSGDGIVLDSSTSLCVLHSTNVPFVGLYSILLFFIVIFGFYFRERYLNNSLLNNERGEEFANSN